MPNFSPQEINAMGFHLFAFVESAWIIPSWI
jgi:hypothetical protein